MLHESHVLPPGPSARPGSQMPQPLPRPDPRTWPTLFPSQADQGRVSPWLATTQPGQYLHIQFPSPSCPLRTQMEGHTARHGLRHLEQPPENSDTPSKYRDFDFPWAKLINGRQEMRALKDKFSLHPPYFQLPRETPLSRTQLPGTHCPFMAHREAVADTAVHTLCVSLLRLRNQVPRTGGLTQGNLFLTVLECRSLSSRHLQGGYCLMPLDLACR